MNIMPSCTSGVISFMLSGSDQLQAGRNCETLLRLICANGLKPSAS